MQSNLSLPDQTRANLFRQPWLAILAGLLIVQLILVGVVYWPRGNNVDAGAPLLPDLSVDAVTAITITDDNEQTVRLVREDEMWALAESDGFPAQEADVTALLDAIAGLRTDRLVASTPRSHAQLEVAAGQFVRRIDLTLADGQEITLYVGSSPRARATHVRVANQDEVYLASDLSSFDANARVADWINTTYFQVPREQIVKVTLENANGTFEFTRDESNTWQMAGLNEDETFNPNNLESLLTSLSGLRMVAPVGKETKPAHGLDDPAAVVTVVVETEDGAEQTHTLRIGARDAESDNYVVASSDSPYVVEVAPYTVQRFLERTRADFLIAPEEEAAAETEASPPAD